MPDIYHLDYETYSETDLRDVGAYRYASDPSTRILLCAIAKNDEEPVLWDSTKTVVPGRWESDKALGLITEMANDENALVYAHNAQFEVAVSRYLFFKTFWTTPPVLRRWRCTASMCRRLAIPFSLAEAAEFLGLGQQKDKRGDALIRHFCTPQKSKQVTGQLLPVEHADLKITVAGEKLTVAEAWTAFREYCRQDVRTERELHKRLAPVEMTGAVLDGFLADMEMNDRGIPVDVPSLKKAQNIVNGYTSKLVEECRELTGGIVPTQRDALIAWLRERGYQGQDLRAATLDAALEEDEPDVEGTGGILWSADAQPEARRVLEIRQLASYAAVKKIPAMIDAACEDDRVRGGVMWYGALRTGRSSGRLIQPHNFKRPDGSILTHDAFQTICEGGDDMDLNNLYGPPLEVIASCMRHFIRLPGHQFLDADFAQIEARVLAWMSGAANVLDSFRRGEDLYKKTASMMFNVRLEDVTKDQRFFGKIAVLACGYYGSVNAFASMARLYGVEIGEKKAWQMVKLYRESNPEITRFWKAVGYASVNAVKEPGRAFKLATCEIAFVMKRIAGVHFLLAKLPSGRCLCYPNPGIVRSKKEHVDRDTGEVREWDSDDLSFYGQLPQSVHWGRVQTHSGVLTENLTQAIAGDFLTHGLVNVIREGFRPFLPIHDQLLSEYHPENGDTVERYEKALCALPPWAPGFPLAADAKIVPYYLKD